MRWRTRGRTILLERRRLNRLLPASGVVRPLAIRDWRDATSAFGGGVLVSGPLGRVPPTPLLPWTRRGSLHWRPPSVPGQ